MELENLKSIVLLQSTIIEKLVIKELERDKAPTYIVPGKQELKKQLNELKELVSSFK